MSADAAGEAGGDRGTGDGGLVGDSVFLNTISDSSASYIGSFCLLFRAASRCDFLRFFLTADLMAAEERSPIEKCSLFSRFPLPVN